MNGTPPGDEGGRKGLEWVETTHPPVPPEFAIWLELSDVQDRPRSDGFFDAGLKALRRALDPKGRERKGAFDLLAADGLLTYAAEHALREEDPGRLLEDMVVRVASGEWEAADRG